MRKCLLIVLLLFCVTLVNAYAVEVEEEELEIPNLAGLGVLIHDGPYKGRDVQVVPVPLIYWDNGRFFVREEKAGVILHKTDNLGFNAFIKPRFSGYDDEDSNDLDGMEGRDYSLDGGLQLVLGIPGVKHLNLETAVSGDLLSRHRGMQIDTKLHKLFVLTPVFIKPSIGVSWQSENLVDYYYGVRPDEVTAARSAYNPDSAVNGNVALDIYLALSEEWLVVSRVKCDFLNSEIKDSPIVDEDVTITSFIGLTRMF